MSTKQHTPGPWAIDSGPWEGSRETDKILGPPADPNEGGATLICTTVYRRANARLIASAPDLLAACEEALTTLDGSGNAAVKTLRAAIAKAKGGPSCKV